MDPIIALIIFLFVFIVSAFSITGYIMEKKLKENEKKKLS